ncbi:BQ2448_1037 [Microbotryum intermedium]|uniref:BQ2448_1037 protein n=1 Tax=Microbotryum intermedium TaxID=269621 RepID=A0A238FCV0_9BASI|nr:BQ2448_1037 [Microbotryum intermedium]
MVRAHSSQEEGVQATQHLEPTCDDGPSTPNKATTSLGPVSLLSASPIVATAEATDAVVTVIADHADLVSLRESVHTHSLPRSVDSSASSVHTAHSTANTFDHSTTNHHSTAGTSPSSPSALRALRERLAADSEAQHQQHVAAMSTDDSPNKLRKKRPPPSLLAEQHESSQEEDKSNGLGPNVEQAAPEDESYENAAEAAQEGVSTSTQSVPNGSSPEDTSPIDDDLREAYRPRPPTPSSESALISLVLAPPRFVRQVASSSTSFGYNTTVRVVYLPIHFAQSVIQVSITVAQSLPVVGGYLKPGSPSSSSSEESNSTTQPSLSATEPTSGNSNSAPRLSRPSEHEGTISSSSSPEDDDEFGPKGLIYHTAETAAGVAIAAAILPFAAAGLIWGAWVRRGEVRGMNGKSGSKAI